MSYVHKKSRLFDNEVEKIPYKVRSEGRMKTYASSIDFRAWSDVMEDRKKHILERLGTTRMSSATTELIPVDCLVEAIFASKNQRLKQLKKRSDYFEELVDIYSHINLTPEQEEQLSVMRSNLQATYLEIKQLREGSVICKEKEHDDFEMLKLFEAEWNENEPNTERSNYLSTTPCSLTSLDYHPCTDLNKRVLIENMKNGALMGGIVTLSNSTPKIIPGGYFAGSEPPTPKELKFIYKKESDIDEVAPDIEDDEYNFSIDLTEIIPEANDIPELTFEHFSDSDLSTEITTDDMKLTLTDISEESVKEPKGFRDSILTQTEIALTTDKVQTEDIQNIFKYKIESITNSSSCPCFNQAARMKMIATTTEKLGFTPNLPNLKLRFFHIDNSKKWFEEKCCGSDNKIDVFKICKKNSSKLIIKRQAEERLQRNNTDYKSTQKIFDSKEDLSTLLVHKNAEIMALKNALKAKESHSAERKKNTTATLEKLDSIRNVIEERDDLRKKLERSQDELNQLKKKVELNKSFGPPVEATCETDRELESISTCNLTPKSKAKIITREMQVARKFTAQINAVHKENEQLKEKLLKFEVIFNKLGVQELSNAYLDELQIKLDTLEETTRERDELKNKVESLESQFSILNYLPDDIEVFRQRSLVLDEVLQDRDRLSKRVEQLRGLDEEAANLRKKALRVDQLEEDLRKMERERKITEEEVDYLRGKCSLAEIEVLNHRADGDTLRSKLTCIEHEIENLKSVTIEKESLKSERDHLKKSIDELGRMQSEYEHMKKQMKCLDILKAERDMFKSKYENLIGLECECDILRTQVEKAKIIENERDALETQIEELEVCVSEQEGEIRRLVCHIDMLAKGRDDHQEKLKEVISNLRSELEKKDSVIISAEEKLALLQRELGNSIYGLSTETIDMKLKNEKLEKAIDASERELKDLRKQISLLVKDNQDLATKVNDLVDDNNFLMNKLEEKENSLNTLKEVLQDHEIILDQFQKSQFKEGVRDMETETDTLDLLTLEAAREQSRTIQEKLANMSSVAGDRYLQNLLVQSKIAVQKIAQELERQYKDWDWFKDKIRDPEKRSPTGAIVTYKDVYTVGYCYTTEVDEGSGTQKKTCPCGQKEQDDKSTGRDQSQEVALSTRDDETIEISTGRNAPCTKCTQTEPIGILKTEQPSQTETEKKVEIFVDAPPCPSSKDIQTTDDVCTCVDAEAMTEDPDADYPDAEGPFEYDITKWSCYQKEPKNNDDESIDPREPQEQEVEAFESARSIDCVRCKSLGERLQVLERELSAANDTILGLKDKADRVGDENSALRRHSTDVQEVAKDQIKDLVGHLKDTQERCSCLEKDKDKIVQYNYAIILEKNQLLGVVKDLENQKEELEKILASNIVTNSRRNTIIEGDLESLRKENKELKGEINGLKKLEKIKEELAICQQENKELKEALDEVKSQAVNPDLVKSLQLENENLNKKVEDQFQEISQLVDKVKSPTLPKQVMEIQVDKDKGTLKSITDDLENQLKGLQKLAQVGPPDAVLQNTIENITRRLEMVEKRAEKAETALRNFKATDPAAMLRAEIAKLKEKLSKTEEENEKLNRALYQKKLEIEAQRNEFQNIQDKAKELNDKNLTLQKLNEELNKCLKELKNDNEIDKIQQSQYEKELQNSTNELRSAYDRIANLQHDISTLKQELMRSQKDGEKLRKELETIKRNVHKEKAEQLEKDKLKLEKENHDLYTDLTRLKKELDETLNSSTLSSVRVSELQDETGQLKQKQSQIEGDNIKLRKDLENAITSSKEVWEKLREAVDENNILKSANAAAGDQLSKVKYELENAILDAQKSFSQRDSELQIIKEKTCKVETENTKLKKELEEAIHSANEANSEIAKLLQNIGLLQNEKDNLKKELEAGNPESGDNNLKSIIGNLESENNKLSKESIKLLDDLTKANNTILESRNEISKLKSKITLLESENDNLKIDINQELDNSKRTNCELMKLKEHEANLKQRLAHLETENLNLKNDLDNMDITNKNNSSQIQQLKDDILRQKLEMCNLQQENSQLKKDIECTIKEISNKNETEIWKQKASHMEEMNKNLKQDMDKKYKEYKDCSKKLLQVQNENMNLQKKIYELESEIEQLKKQYEGSMGDSKRKLSDLEKSKTNEERLKELTSQLQDQNNQLNDKICSITNNLTECRNEVDDLKQKNRKLELENKKYKKDFEDFCNKQSTLAQLRSEITSLKERIAHLETENVKLKKEYDIKTSAEMKRREDSLSPLESPRLKEKLNQLEEESKKLKIDLSNALNEAKKYAQLQDLDMKLKQQLAVIETEKAKLKRDLEKALESAEKGSSEVGQLKEENSKMKEKIKELEIEISNLKTELDFALENTKKGVTGISEMQDNDAKQKQKILQLEKNIEILRNDLETAVKFAKSDNDAATQLRSDNTKQKQHIAELEHEITQLKSAVEKLRESRKKDDSTKKLVELQKENSSLNKRLEESENSKSQCLTENKNLKEKLLQLQTDIEKLTKIINGITNERNKLIADITKMKENEDYSRKRIADLEAINFHLKEGIEASKSNCTSSTEILKEENEALNKIIKEMDNEKKNLKLHLDNALIDGKNKTNEIEKMKEDFIKLRLKIAELEKTKTKLRVDVDTQRMKLSNQLKQLSDKAEHLTDEEKQYIQIQCEENMASLQRAHEEALNRIRQELQEAINDRDKLKNLLADQKRKSKDIKGKVDQVEGIINNERRKLKEEQLRNRELEAKLQELNEQLQTLNKQLESKNDEFADIERNLQEKIEQMQSKLNQKDVVIVMPPISEKEMKFFGKPSCACKPNFINTAKKLAEAGLDSLTPDELQLLNNKLAETTADRLAQMGKTCGVLKPDEDNKLSLLKKIASLEGDLVKKQKHAQQKVVAMQYAVKLEKDRLIELKKKLDEERMKNQQLLSEMGLESRPVSGHSQEHEGMSPRSDQEPQTSHHSGGNVGQQRMISGDVVKHIKKKDSSEKTTPKTTATMKMKCHHEGPHKCCHRCRSPSSTPVKDTNASSSLSKTPIQTSSGPDKAQKSLHSKGMPSSSGSRMQ